MIELNILEPLSEDFRSFFNHIIIGTDTNCDLILNQTSHNKLILEFRNDNLICYLKKSSHFFYHNKKKVFGIIQVKKNDLITFDEIEFKILNFSETKHCDLNLLIKERYEDKIKNNALLKNKLELIEEKIDILKKEILKDV